MFLGMSKEIREAIKASVEAYIGEPVDDLTAMQHYNIAPLVWPIHKDGEQAYPCLPEDANAVFVVDPAAVAEGVGDGRRNLQLEGQVFTLKEVMRESAN